MIVPFVVKLQKHKEVYDFYGY